jgi:transcription antitermination factor NusG
MGEACPDNAKYNGAVLPNEYAASTNAHVAWYVLRTRVGGELAAAANLEYRGFSPYCPMQKERRRYTDRIKIVETAVFSGYVFCQFNVREKLPIVSCPGVEYIVGFADGPAPVPEEELDSVRRMIDAGATAVKSLSRGERVRVTHGPLEGVEGVLVRDSSGDRLVVSINLLNRGTSLLINQDQVCPVEEIQ